MTLVQLREKFAKLSGRYDLVGSTTTWTDNGADFHLQAGQRHLEKLTARGEGYGRFYGSLAVDAYSLTFAHSPRWISRVVAQSADGRRELKKLSYEEFQSLFPDTVAETDSGESTYYTIVPLRTVENSDQDSVGTFLNVQLAEDSTANGSMAILIGPPTDEVLVLEVHGVFQHQLLSDDADVNWWSETYPNLLLYAGLRSLEVFNRNSEGVADWDRAIATEVLELERDVVQEECARVTQLKG